MITLLTAFILIAFSFYSCYGWPVKSYREIRFRRIIGQSSTVNCGPASLGTILDRFFQVPTTQKELVDLILGYIEERTNVEGRVELGGEGVSMLDLKRASQAKGVPARGYRLPRDKLLFLLHSLKLPLLLHFERPDDHFVVALGGEERAKMVIIADPSWGIKTIQLYDLKERWDGLLLAFAPSERSAIKARSEINDVVRVTGNKLSNLWFAGRASWNMFQGE